jgi:ubiquinone/menaquinone biosynthesis C-methylase UbiE
MKTIISPGDFTDVYYKFRSSGLNKILSRFAFSKKGRTKKAWNGGNSGVDNWWSIPAVRQRWNFLITGNPNTDYSDYLINKYFSDRKDLIMLSPGCGTGGKELKFARMDNFSGIEAFDLAPGRIDLARKNAESLSLKNIEYKVSDALKFEFKKEYYDIIIFDSFLHHVNKLDEILDKVRLSIKPGGIFVINEYVGPNRFQWSKEQLKLSNDVLRSLPRAFRIRRQSNAVKSNIYRPGLIRMILSDPSEAVDSENILSKIHKRFNTLEEKPYGGNILQLVLKDIAHNFTEGEAESEELLKALFGEEDKFLESGNNSDFVFGVYSK